MQNNKHYVGLEQRTPKAAMAAAAAARHKTKNKISKTCNYKIAAQPKQFRVAHFTRLCVFASLLLLF